MTQNYFQIREKAIREAGLQNVDPSKWTRTDRYAVDKKITEAGADMSQYGSKFNSLYNKQMDGAEREKQVQGLIDGSPEMQDSAASAAADNSLKNMWGDFGGGSDGSAFPFGLYGGDGNQGGNDNRNSGYSSNQSDETSDQEEQEEAQEEEEGGDDSDPDKLAEQDPQGGYDDENEGGGLDTSDETRAREDQREALRNDEEKDEDDSGAQPEPKIGEGTKANKGAGGSGGGTGTPTAKGAEVAKDVAATAKKVEEAAETVKKVSFLVKYWPLLLSIFVAIIVFFLVFFLFQTIAAANPGELSAGTNKSNTTVICLDPGHKSHNSAGNMASGAVSKDGTLERELNLILANELEAELQSRGYKVVKTKTKVDEYVSNEGRVQICADAGAAIDYRIHFDCNIETDNCGVPGPWHEVPGPSYTNVHDTSLSYANIIHAALVKELGIEGHTSGVQPVNGGVKNDTTVLIGSQEANRLNIPAVLLEMMTMDNANVAWIKNDSNRSKVIKGIANGIQDAIPTSSGGPAAQQAVEYARSQIGKMYSQAQRCPYTTAPPADSCDYWDCSSLVTWAWYWASNKTINIGGTTAVMWSKRDDTNLWTRVNSFSDIQAGDILLKGGGGHVMIASGTGTIIEATQTGKPVVEKTISESYFVSNSYIYLRPVVK